MFACGRYASLLVIAFELLVEKFMMGGVSRHAENGVEGFIEVVHHRFMSIMFIPACRAFRHTSAKQDTSLSITIPILTYMQSSSFLWDIYTCQCRCETTLGAHAHPLFLVFHLTASAYTSSF